jgi:general secretion pathway protein B
MSYILDALKKADNERERELSAVPGLHAQADGASERTGAMPWRIVALGALVLLAAWIAWLVLGRSESTVPVVMAPAQSEPVAAPAPPLPAPMPTPAPAPPSPPMAAPPPPAAAMQAPPPMTAPPPPAPRPQPAPVTARPAPAPAPAAAPPAVAATPKAAAPSAEARIPTRNELPAAVRAAMPPLNISGAVYSATPSARMLFANGLVLREGDAAGADLKVERIGPSASVLSFRGQSFQVKH